jgi:hypothetical protein
MMGTALASHSRVERPHGYTPGSLRMNPLTCLPGTLLPDSLLGEP